MKLTHKNSKSYRSILKMMRLEAMKIKNEMKSKFGEKMDHLRSKYRDMEDELLRKVPTGLEEYATLSVFDSKMFDEIEIQDYNIEILGDVEMTNDELAVLKLHPKFSIISSLKEGGIDFEQEAAFAKMRIEITKDAERSEGNDEHITEEERKDDENRRKVMDEHEAESRQVFDPVKGVFDNRKRRVTDLKECNRVFLPKPLEAEQEAMFEVRRSTQRRIYNQCRDENCNKFGDQRSNLTAGQEAALKNLMKRVAKRDLIIMKTDKSGRFVVASEEEYKKLGEVHTRKDRKIDRQELIEIERQLNGHSTAWAKMWNSGVNHGHKGRIISSKKTTSNNTSDMYLLSKDHKKEKGKTRPVVTGCTSNTLGMSNNVAELLEAVANSEPDPYEVISSEDMLARTKRFNMKVLAKKEEWIRKRERKLGCRTCQFEEIIFHCKLCKEEITYITNKEDLSGEGEMKDQEERKQSREEIKEMFEEILERNCCSIEIKLKMKEDCVDCGPGMTEEDQEVCIIGNDVVALFPSIKSESTGKIVRKRVEDSPLDFDGFEFKHGLRYIVINRRYTSDLKELWGVLPYRRKVQGTAPGMTGKEMNAQEDDPEYQWVFPRKELTTKQKRQVIGRVAEIGVRIVFEHFTYRFGGDVYRQMEGGPIGARVTMAAARLVMQTWGESYRRILENSGLTVDLLAGYVDDGRQVSSVFRRGMRFRRESGKFEWDAEAEAEDDKLAETINVRMARICLVAMNSINSDLVFTVEVPEEFPMGRLPTLDFSLWLEDGLINHTYYEKEMKTPFLLMNDSAMGDHQRASILSNELVRRLSNVNLGHIDHGEILAIIEVFIRQLKSSGYSQKHSRDRVIEGIKGWKNRWKQRTKEGNGFYREAKHTLKSRVRKKLVERENWYKGKDHQSEESEDEEEETGWKGKTSYEERNKRRKNGKNDKERKGEGNPVKAVMFVEHTHGSSLAKKLRENEFKMEEMTGVRLKIVERAGTKLEDILPVSNPWKGQDCMRQGCKLCDTKSYTGKSLRQPCDKRSLLYENYCITCEEKDAAQIDNEVADEKEKKLRKGKIKLHKYIGETSRSVYERSWEHWSAMEQLNPGSHLLKHLLDIHEEEDHAGVKFGVRVVMFTQSSFERQLQESVVIQQERHHHHLLNSRSEYNRCAVPRLTSKIGDNQYKKYEKEIEEEKEKEEILESKIRKMRKERNRGRKPTKNRDQPASKRVKVDENTYKPVRDNWGKPAQKEKGEKRKGEEEESPKAGKRMRQMKIEKTKTQQQHPTKDQSKLRLGMTV